MDAGPPYDAAACPSLGGYLRCGPDCGGRWCNVGVYCDTPTTVCAPGMFDEHDVLDRRSERCSLNTLESARPAGQYCPDGRVCVGLRTELEDGDGHFSGMCLREEYCDDAAGVVEGIVCVWSDLSERATGAPVETTCPPSDPRAGLCGGPCGDCPWDPPPFWQAISQNFQVGCIGRSDQRGIGACAQRTQFQCVPGTEYTADSICANDTEIPPPILGGDPCACLVLEDPNAPGTFLPQGWATLGTTCAQYRVLYPGQVRCLDSEWNEIE